MARSAKVRRSRKPPAETDTIAGRLQWAIDRMPADGRQRGARLFQRRISAAADRKGFRRIGVSLPQILAFTDDRATPSTNFLALAAEVLDVRPEWLAFKLGAPTAAHEVRAASSSAIDLAAANLRDLVLRAFNAEPMTRQREAGGVDVGQFPPWVAPLAEVFVRLMAADPCPDAKAPSLERRLAEALAAPADSLGLDLRDLRNSGVFTDYIVAMIPALLVLAAAKRRAAVDRQEQMQDDKPRK